MKRSDGRVGLPVCLVASLGVAVEEEGEGWTTASTAPSVPGSSPRRDGPSPASIARAVSLSLHSSHSSHPPSIQPTISLRRHTDMFPRLHRGLWTQPRTLFSPSEVFSTFIRCQFHDMSLRYWSYSFIKLLKWTCIFDSNIYIVGYILSIALWCPPPVTVVPSSSCLRLFRLPLLQTSFTAFFKRCFDSFILSRRVFFFSFSTPTLCVCGRNPRRPIRSAWSCENKWLAVLCCVQV